VKKKYKRVMARERRAVGGRPVTDDDQLRAWREALAARARDQRRRRVRRRRDPWRNPKPVTYRPAPPPRTDDDDTATTDP
jgi:hypothetical protein